MDVLSFQKPCIQSVQNNNALDDDLRNDERSRFEQMRKIVYQLKYFKDHF